MAPPSLTLFVPGLYGLPGEAADAASPPVPALEALFARGEASSPLPQGADGLEATVFRLFGLEAPDEADLPVAPVTRALDMGVIDKEWWLRADPVHLRPDRDRLILVDTQLVSLTQGEADGLAAELLGAYARDGWTLKAPRPSRWYLKPPHAMPIQTTPLSAVVGHDIHPYLPKGKDGKAWRTVMNEMQILLHTARVNTERERRGELPINSLWFWGAGRLPEIQRVEWDQVHSEEPVSLALARLSNAESRARPRHYGDWQMQSPVGSHLVVLDEAVPAMQYRDHAQWTAILERLDREWMAPVLSALKRRELAQLTVCSDRGATFRVDARMARRWWRRRRPLSVSR